MYSRSLCGLRVLDDVNIYTSFACSVIQMNCVLFCSKQFLWHLMCCNLQPKHRVVSMFEFFGDVCNSKLKKARVQSWAQTQYDIHLFFGEVHITASEWAKLCCVPVHVRLLWAKEYFSTFFKGDQCVLRREKFWLYRYGLCHARVF